MYQKTFAAALLAGDAIPLAWQNPATAQEYPSKPIHIIIPYGAGSGVNLFFEWIKKEYGVDMVHVPYKNPTDLIQSTITGQTSVTMFGALNFIPLVRSGKVKALGVSARTPLLPDVPTLAEQGIAIDASNWFGYFAPSGTPDAIVRRLRDEVARIYAIPAFREKNLIGQALVPVASTPEEFARSIPGEVAQGAELIRISGVERR